MKSKVLFEVAIVIGCFLLIFAMVSRAIWPSGSALAQQELLHLSKSIKIGNTRAQVSTSYLKGRYKWLTRNADTKYSEGDNYISTPGSAMGWNWNLVVKFKNDKVNAVLFRTSDDDGSKPPNTPPDLRE